MNFRVRKLTRAERNARIVTDIRNKAGVGKPRDPHMQVKKHVAEIAVAMAEIHGGDWKTLIDHENGLVMIARRGRLRRTI